MYLKTHITIEGSAHPVVARDYRGSVMALLKNSIKALDKRVYEDYFSSNRPKAYSWSLSFPKDTNFNNDCIVMGSNQLVLTMTFAVDTDCFLFNTALSTYKSTSTFMGYRYSIGKVSVHKNKAYATAILAKTRSNILVVKHTDGHDHYLLPEDKDYINYMKRALETKLRYCGRADLVTSIDTLAIKLGNYKRHLVDFYSTKAPTISGTIALVGNKELINFMANSGIGSCTGSGMGLVKVVKAFD